MSKTKVFIFTGPVAACKSFLSRLIGNNIDQLNVLSRPLFYHIPDRIFQINFDQCTRSPEMERTLGCIDGVLRAEYMAKNLSVDIVIDGWFSFDSRDQWWDPNDQNDPDDRRDPNAMDLSLQLFESKLGPNFELIPVVLFRDPDQIMGEIDKGVKRHYPDYKKGLPKVYNFLFRNLMHWFNEKNNDDED